jgi:hypothetical protein
MVIVREHLNTVADVATSLSSSTAICANVTTFPCVDIITRSSELKARNSNNRNPASLEPLPIA